MTAPDRPRPAALRRIERRIVGAVMGVIAFILEKAVLRSIRRAGTASPAPPETSTVVSKGAEVDVEEPPRGANGTRP